ncbi:MAG: VOC family protein [Ignavibacteria bacterium]|nr:VOC family protein [Ignavibacteria bacterium]
MPRVIHFEIVSTDTEKSKKFYENVFDWKFNQFGEEQYWLISTGDPNARGIDGGLAKSKGEAVITNIIDVPDLELYIDKVEKNGGNIVVPKNGIPGVGWLCYFKDNTGNLFGLMQHDPNAK